MKTRYVICAVWGPHIREITEGFDSAEQAVRTFRRKMKSGFKKMPSAALIISHARHLGITFRIATVYL